MTNLFMARGPWVNWKASLDDASKRNVNTVRWGAPEKNRHGKLDLGNKGNWDTLQLGDRVYFANQLSDLGPFSKQVVFGFGDVVDKFEQKQPYWPDEKKTNQVIYKYVFDVKPTFMTLNDNGAVEWIRGLPRTKGFSPIKDKDMIKKLEAAFGQHGAKPTSTFKFVEEDFKCERTKEDSKYRRGRFRDLVDAIIPELSPRFDAVKNDLGLSVQSRKREYSYLGKNLTRNPPTKYFDHTWLGIYLKQPPPNPTSNKLDFRFSSRDTVQFQVSLNTTDPLWSGIYIGRGNGVKQTRKNILTLLKEQRKECLRIFKAIPKGYMIRIYGASRPDHTADLLGEWITSELKDNDIDDILKKYSDRGADFRICKFFTKKEALKP